MAALQHCQKVIRKTLLVILAGLFFALAVYAYNAAKSVSYANEW